MRMGGWMGEGSVEGQNGDGDGDGGRSSSSIN
jgi:hypothetical protein